MSGTRFDLEAGTYYLTLTNAFSSSADNYHINLRFVGASRENTFIMRLNSPSGVEISGHGAENSFFFENCTLVSSGTLFTSRRPAGTCDLYLKNCTLIVGANVVHMRETFRRLIMENCTIMNYGRFDTTSPWSCVYREEEGISVQQSIIFNNVLLNLHWTDFSDVNNGQTYLVRYDDRFTTSSRQTNSFNLVINNVSFDSHSPFKFLHHLVRYESMDGVLVTTIGSRSIYIYNTNVPTLRAPIFNSSSTSLVQ
jgi:hypothetical protein